jgi:molecular chaperone DnaK
VHATEKSLQELGEKVSGEDRVGVESALSDLRTALKGDDKDAIDRKAEQLAKAAGGIAERAAAASAGAQPGSGPTADDAKKDENVVDAEFEEVKDKNRGNA